MRLPRNILRLTASGSAPLIVLLLTSPPSAFGNLGLFSASDIQRTGNLVPIRKSAIQLLNETLTAKVNAETVAVSVTYDFLNKSGDDDVTVGFPIDLMPPVGEGTSYTVDHWQNDGLKDLRIFDGTAQVPIDRTIEEPLSAKDRPKGIKDIAVKRRWSIATLRFQGHQQKTVRIIYTVNCMGVDTGFEHDVRDWKYSPRTFLYTFRPASSWGDGKIRKLDISVDATFLEQNSFSILEVSPKPETSQAGMFHWQYSNRDLNRIPDLVLTYDSTPALFQGNAERNLLAARTWNFTVCGSSNARTTSLLDGNPRTAWLSGSRKKGDGSCFEIRPHKGTYLHSVAILNGNFASQREYAAHPRIKKLRIEYLAATEEGPKRESVEQVFPDRKYDERSLKFPAYSADFLPQTPEGIIELSKFTVLELYPGTESHPLAISEIYIYGVTPKP